MTKTEFATAVGWNEKSLSGRLGALGLLNVCSRCGGSGHFSSCATHGTICFGCSGSGKGLPKLSAGLVKTVQAKVAAGELDGYLILCKARAEARILIKPLVAAAKTVYGIVGQAYDIEYRRFINCPLDDERRRFDPRVSAAQDMNNALFYGDTQRPSSDPSTMSISEIESAFKYGKVDSLTAVNVIRERIEQLEKVRDAFLRGN